jgi:DNA-directed RNA polymerase
MPELVERFAAELMRRENDKAKKRRNDRLTVAADLAIAQQFKDQPLWLDYQTCKRGRAYPTAHFSFDRPDHMRSMLEFGQLSRRENGVGIGWKSIAPIVMAKLIRCHGMFVPCGSKTTLD